MVKTIIFSVNFESRPNRCLNAKKHGYYTVYAFITIMSPTASISCFLYFSFLSQPKVHSYFALLFNNNHLYSSYILQYFKNLDRNYWLLYLVSMSSSNINTKLFCFVGFYILYCLIVWSITEPFFVNSLFARIIWTIVELLLAVQ